jgi:glyceraldehyde-3-phosphate dehydrogenase/erythrose-4-phosphate dehydrogenase
LTICGYNYIVRINTQKRINNRQSTVINSKGANMDSQKQTPAMNQKIFTLGLSVETISVYLVCCNLEDNDTTISTKNISSMWNGEAASMLQGLKDLEERNILRKIISDNEENVVYQLSHVEKWKSS